MQEALYKQNFIRQSKAMAANTAFITLGIELTDVGDDYIILEMPITDAARQPQGLLHGGISMVLAESAASLHACWKVDLTQKVPVGIEINGSHLRSASNGSVRAVGKLIRRSNALIVHQVEIFHVDTEKLLSTARVTNYYKFTGEPGRKYDKQ